MIVQMIVKMCFGFFFFKQKTAYEMRISDWSSDVCSSDLSEYGGEVATYCAGYKEADLPEIAALSDHLIFNSPEQIERFRPLLDELRARGGTVDVGLRINPMHSEGEVAKYDPAAPYSRLDRKSTRLNSSH